MATVRKVISIAAPPSEVWDAVRDVGAVHERFTPGVAIATVLEPGARMVTFANGLIVRELIVTVDDEDQRLAYTSVGSRLSHHNASVEVFDDGEGGTRIIWTTDILPDELTSTIADLVDAGSAAMKKKLEAR